MKGKMYPPPEYVWGEIPASESLPSTKSKQNKIAKSDQTIA